LDGTFKESVKVGNSEQETNIQFADLTKQGLGIQVTDVSTFEGAVLAIGKITSALEKVQAERSNAGQQLRQIQSVNQAFETSQLNRKYVDDQIRDVNIAEETAMISRNQIMNQAALSVLAQANQNPQIALRLLS
jgi:flagellin